LKDLSVEVKLCSILWLHSQSGFMNANSEMTCLKLGGPYHCSVSLTMAGHQVILGNESIYLFIHLFC